MLTRLVLGSILASTLLVFVACSSDAGVAATTTDAGSDASTSGADTGTGPTGNTATGGACEGTQASAATCSGQICITLNDNVQNKTGICSAQCSETKPCAAGSTCIAFTNLGGDFCLKDCTSDASCTDGFTCVLGDETTGAKFCFVVPTAGGADGGTDAGGDAGGDYCKAQDCDILTDTTGYCDNNPAAKRVCDCPKGSAPNPSCTAAQTGANLFCCPAAP